MSDVKFDEVDELSDNSAALPKNNLPAQKRITYENQSIATENIHSLLNRNLDAKEHSFEQLRLPLPPQMIQSHTLTDKELAGPHRLSSSHSTPLVFENVRKNDVIQQFRKEIPGSVKKPPQALEIKEAPLTFVEDNQDMKQSQQIGVNMG